MSGTNFAHWQIGLATDAGAVRKVNEDAAFVRAMADPAGDEVAIAVVADGMGGYEGGDLASQTAVAMIEMWWYERLPKLLKQQQFIKKIAVELNTCVYNINERLLEIGQKMRQKLGTTLSALLLYKGEYVIFHIGDSRIYRSSGRSHSFQSYVRRLSQESIAAAEPVFLEETEILTSDGYITQLTEDHSWVQAQVRLGQMTKEEARVHTKRNVLVQCLGLEQGVVPYQTRGIYQPHDIFLLCTDGYYSVYSDEEIRFMLEALEERYTRFQSVCDKLTRYARWSGSTDNITVALLRHIYAGQSHALSIQNKQ